MNSADASTVYRHNKGNFSHLPVRDTLSSSPSAGLTNEKGTSPRGFTACVRARDVWPIISRAVEGGWQERTRWKYDKKNRARKSAHFKKKLVGRKTGEKQYTWISSRIRASNHLLRIDACLAEKRKATVDVISDWPNGGADTRDGEGGVRTQALRRKPRRNPPSDGVSTQHSCFRLRWLHEPFYLHTAFLRSPRLHFTSIRNTSLPRYFLFSRTSSTFSRSADAPTLPSFHAEAGGRHRQRQSDHSDFFFLIILTHLVIRFQGNV